MENARRRFIPLSAALVLAVAILAAALVAWGGGEEDAAGKDVQTVSFHEPEDPGADPFTQPADVRGEEAVPVSSAGGSQPFGGRGSNRV
jgi:hypothetical protein